VEAEMQQYHVLQTSLIKDLVCHIPSKCNSGCWIWNMQQSAGRGTDSVLLEETELHACIAGVWRQISLMSRIQSWCLLNNTAHHITWTN